MSACWHAQQPGQWPIMFQSARDALQADGLLGRNLRGADGYLEFTRVFRALSEGLGISFWELEHLCARSTIDSPLDSDSSPRRCWSTTRTSGSKQRVRCSPGWKSDGRRRKAPETADNAHDLRRVLCRLDRDAVRQVPGWPVAGCDTRAVSPELTFDTSGDWADIGSADCLSNDHPCRMAK